ncbi:MAG: DNA-3-methyladenine glycosylase I [Pseudomonadota bacterium]
MTTDDRVRCSWAANGDALEQAYHDEEWGVPVHDDRVLFEFILLEGAQAGLSWRTVLHKRDGYRRCFADFDPAVVATFDEARQAELLQDAGIVRNRLKVASAVTNARAFLEIQGAFGSFDAYLWDFVDGQPIANRPASMADVPASTRLSDRISKDLKKRGFRFVGTTIIYAYLQAVGVVDDHMATCFRAAELDAAR